MPEKAKGIVKEYGKCLIAIALVAAALVFVWFYVLKGTYMPIQHVSSISDGRFKVSAGCVRSIYIKSADGFEKNIDGVNVYIKDASGKEVWKSDKALAGISDQEYLQIFDSDPETGINLSNGTYFIGTDQDEGKTKPYVFKLYENRGSFAKIYAAIALEILLIVIIFMFIYVRKDMGAHKVFLILAIAFGIFINTIFPPLSVPDEASHFKEAYENSSVFLYGFMKEKIQVGNENYRLMVRATDYDSIFYLHDISSIAGWYEGLTDKAELIRVPLDYDSSVTADSIYSYLPASLGITVARGLRLNGRWLLYLGRMTAFAACIFLIYMAIKRMPKNKYLMMTIALLPQSMFSFASYSYDGINLALCIFAVGYVMYLYSEKPKKMILRIAVLLAAIIFMIPIKMAYLPFILLPLLLIDADMVKAFFKDKKKTLIGIAAVLVILVIAVIGIISIKDTVFGMIGYGSLPDEGLTPESRITVSYVMGHFYDITQRYYETLRFGSPNYLVQMLGSVPGKLSDGTHSYVMSIFLVIWSLFTMFVCCIGDDDLIIGGVRKTIVFITGISCILLVYTGLLLGETLIMNWRIMGIQGRYFLPVLALSPMIFMIRSFKISEKTRKNLILIGNLGVFVLYYFGAFIYYATHYFWGVDV